MAKFLWLVFTNPTSVEVEDEFNDWYDRQHVPDVLKVPGVKAVQRFRTARPADDVPGRYVATYEIEADDVGEVIARCKARAGTDQMPVSPTLDRQRGRQMLYEAVGERVIAQPA
jgi:hypothetical protein